MVHKIIIALAAVTFAGSMAASTTADAQRGGAGGVRGAAIGGGVPGAAIGGGFRGAAIGGGFRGAAIGGGVPGAAIGGGFRGAAIGGGVRGAAIGGGNFQTALLGRITPASTKANWHFTTPDARIKLKHLYPSI